MAQKADRTQQSAEIQAIRKEMRVRDEQMQAEREEWSKRQARMEEMMRQLELRNNLEIPTASAVPGNSNSNIDAASHNSHTSCVRSNKNIPPWDEKAANAPAAKSKFPVFHIQIASYLRMRTVRMLYMHHNPSRCIRWTALS